jgi:RecA/RadA recombinase
VRLEDLAGITGNMASQLRKNGVVTVARLARLSRSELKRMLRGVSEAKIEEIQKACWKATGGWFKPGSQLAAERKNQVVFSTGCRALDGIIGGGIHSGSITEFAGAYSAGKTECLITALVECLANNPDFGVMYLDSEETFSEIRAVEIAEARGYDAEKLLNRMSMAKVYSTDMLLSLLDEADPLIATKNVKLLLVDSIIAAPRSEYLGRETLWERQQTLNHILRELLNYAKLYGLAVAVTNQVVDNPQILYTKDPIAQKPPAGGNILAHGIETRVYLRRAGSSKTRRIARLIDSSWLPEAECVYQITKKGIEDLPKESDEGEEKNG